LRLTRDSALICAKNKNSSLEAIAEQLGITFTGNTDDIYEAIADLKNSLDASRKMAEQGISSYQSLLKRFNQEVTQSDSVANKSEARINPLGNLTKRLADALNLGNVFGDDDVLDAIANLKHSLQLSQNEVRELQEKTAIPESWKSEPISYFRSILDKLCDRLSLHRANGYELLDGCVSQLVDEVCEVKDLRSERDHYRNILDKLCDRLKAQDIEALEHVAKSQEMSLDFIDQHNDDLRKKLVESQAMSLKYMNRIVELEREVRSLQEPVNTVGCGDDHVDSLRYFADAFKPNALKNFDSDRLSNPELVQIIRSLLN